ncbi:hypothetical protein STEG23_028984 [Scotinomys teguina]
MKNTRCRSYRNPQLVNKQRKDYRVLIPKGDVFLSSRPMNNSPSSAEDPLRGQRSSSGTPENAPCPHPYLSPLESCPSHLLGSRSTRTPLHHKSPPGTHEHPNAIGLEGPRSTQTPLDQEDPGVTKRYWTKRTQEYPRRHWTRRSQKHP